MQKIQGTTLIEVCLATVLLSFILLSTTKLLNTMMQNLIEIKQKQFALNHLKSVREVLEICLSGPSDFIHNQLRNTLNEIKNGLYQGEIKLTEGIDYKSRNLAVIWSNQNTGNCIYEKGKTCVMMTVPNAEKCLGDLH